ncbi:hypothetical protein TSUD_84520 [Trifolium subterraneum]|uniref:MsrB domain-containing protein n=1 Tax=Trifolium subterraneum TaxID=3900 RepID=A0A2Z6PA47_TRISU|nr:hypothetical protein TSUD_84520 [Trifolium subterraneum]
MKVTCFNILRTTTPLSSFNTKPISSIHLLRSNPNPNLLSNTQFTFTAPTISILHPKRTFRSGIVAMASPTPGSVQKSEEEWQAILSPEQFRILRQKGTEYVISPLSNSHSIKLSIS